MVQGRLSPEAMTQTPPDIIPQPLTFRAPSLALLSLYVVDAHDKILYLYIAEREFKRLSGDTNPNKMV